jgi:presenilin-like A22 family membrane protease
MKHNLKVTLILTGLFFISQIIGLLVVNQYIDHNVLEQTGRLEFQPLPGNIERPETSGNGLIILLIFSILIGTGLLLLLIRLKKINIWKAWYAFSVFVTLFFAFGGFFSALVSTIISLILTFFKIFKTNIIVHNLTEVFIYGGLAAIFVPIKEFTIVYAVIILVLISLYDMYAVWKSRHMVTLANFTTESKLFAGLTLPYNTKTKTILKKYTPSLKQQKTKRGEIKNAILGGGDIGFPLLFAGVVMKVLMANNVLWLGFLKSLIVPLFTTISLYILFVKGEKNKFYPAMPFLTAGCLVGYGALWLVDLII